MSSDEKDDDDDTDYSDDEYDVDVDDGPWTSDPVENLKIWLFEYEGGMRGRFAWRYTSRVKWVDSVMHGRMKELNAPKLGKMGKELFRGMKLSAGLATLNIVDIVDVIVTELKEFFMSELRGLFKLLELTFQAVIDGIFSILISLIEETVVYKKYKKHLAPIVTWVEKVRDGFERWTDNYERMQENYELLTDL